MAKFKDLSLDLETGEHIDFDDADTIMMGYDGDELYLTSTLSGVRAVQPYHMVRYDQLTEASGTLQYQINNLTDDHGELNGLLDDDHPQYVPTDGSRGFTSTVSGVAAVEDNDLVTYNQLLNSVEEGTSGAAGHTNIQLNFYRDRTHPYAENDDTVYIVLGDCPYTAPAVPFNTVKLVIRADDINKNHDGWMQIYDVTNNAVIKEFSWVNVYDWTIVTASGFDNVPTSEAVWEIRIKEEAATSTVKGLITHILLY